MKKAAKTRKPAKRAAARKPKASPAVRVRASGQATVSAFVVGRDFNNALRPFDPYDDRLVMVGSQFRGASGRRSGVADNPANKRPTKPSR